VTCEKKLAVGCLADSWDLPAPVYLPQVSLTIFRVVTSRSAYSCLLDAHSTCPSLPRSIQRKFSRCLLG
jgi:hypothetical protein